LSHSHAQVETNLAKDEHGHGHAHHPNLGHHWESLQQQFEAGKLGMWLFLATEVLFFGGLFVAYAIWRGMNPDLFRYGSHYLDTFWGATNTVILILSSMTMALAVTFAQVNKQKALVICLGLTLAGAFGFMAIKYVEYTHKFHEGIFPGAKFYDPPADLSKSHWWDASKPIITREELLAIREAEAAKAAEIPTEQRARVLMSPPASMAEVSAVKPAGVGLAGMHEEPIVQRAGRGTQEHPVHPLQDPHRPVNAHMFFNIYFLMTGLHGIHVLVGIIVIGWLMIRAMRGHFNSEYFTPVDLGGLYWHIVDLIWIFLFPLFYLI
jgi:cytochrome c oxidase subunit III